jgi:hypothetical protein
MRDPSTQPTAVKAASGFPGLLGMFESKMVSATKSVPRNSANKACSFRTSGCSALPLGLEDGTSPSISHCSTRLGFTRLGSKARLALPSRRFTKERQSATEHVGRFRIYLKHSQKAMRWKGLNIRSCSVAKSQSDGLAEPSNFVDG